MSGFARGLAARARGGEVVAALRARRAPRFVPATGAVVGLARDGGLPTAAADGAVSDPPTAQTARRAPAAATLDARAATTRDAPHAPAAVPAPSGARTREALPALPAPTPARAPAPAVAPAAPQTTPAMRGDPAGGAARRPPATAVPTLRSSRRPLAALPATATTPPPRIEVQIGRVEVIAPRPAAAPATRTLRAPAAQRRHPPASPAAGSGFTDLAVARRHLDRIAH